jgi:hypothetical protein
LLLIEIFESKMNDDSRRNAKWLHPISGQFCYGAAWSD